MTALWIAVVVALLWVGARGAMNRWPRPPKQTTWCYCPGCKADLCSQPEAFIEDTDLVRYQCQCGRRSEWTFDAAPVPLLIEDGRIVS